MNNRDPRVDPKRGDELMLGPQWQQERYSILCVSNDGRVEYQIGPMRCRLRASIEEWREWAKGAEVIHVSE